MKKLFFCLTLLLCFPLLLASCNGDTTPADTDTDAPFSSEPVTDPATKPEDVNADTPPAESDTADTETDSEETNIPEILIPAVYPTPMELTVGDSYVDLSKACLHHYVLLYADELEAKGVAFDEKGVNISAEIRDLTELAYGAEEGYILTVNAEGVKIEAQNERGLHYAVMTLLQLTENGKCPAVTVKDAPRNPLRGVIEGFYGAAWTHEYRKDLFAFMGENKMNAYIYAPKDDAKHRAQWRALYTGAELERMTDLITTANKNYVKFIYAISPGGDINLGGGYEADFTKLMAKCEQIYELGCRDFAIFLDDIPTLDAEGHAKLLNDFQTKFVETHEGVSDLIAITTEYTDPFLTAYTDKIAPLIHKDIILMWTGPGVVPASITNASLKNIIKKYDRNLLIWWNYPVNDVLVNNLYMGACEGLETNLYESITGLTANPMNQGYASMVPLFTTGDYLWNPAAYDKDASLEAACKALMPDAADALLGFIGMTCASPMNKNTDSVELNTLLKAFKAENNAETRSALKAYFASMIANADTVLASENKKLTAEISDWLAKYRAYGEMGMAYIEMEEAYAEGKDMNTLLPLLGRYKRAEESISNNARLVSDHVLTPFLHSLATRFGILMGLSGEVTFAPATPYTNCDHYEDFKADYMTDGDDTTYFWTAGTLAQASGGKNGYFGVDLGSVMDVTNVFVATGVGGSDVLTQAAIEYSTDGKSWKELYSGACGAETFLKGLSVKARYVRMRGTDPSNTSWTKVRAFEVNTTRTVVENPAAEPSITTNLPTYQTYVPDNMGDNDANTYFWSGREGRVGDYIQIDLGTVTTVSRITFKSGVPAHSADYINNGELCYSADGKSWTVICAINSRDTVKDVNIRARYIRVNVKATQTSWITVSEFSAVSEDSVSPLLALDEYFIPRTHLLTLTDGHITSYLAADGTEAADRTLRVTVGESGKVTLTAIGLPSEGLTLSVKDSGGAVLQTVQADYITAIEAPASSVIHIPLGNGLMLAEIEW